VTSPTSIRLRASTAGDSSGSMNGFPNEERMKAKDVLGDEKKMAGVPG
jgi:hypothetical protein